MKEGERERWRRVKGKGGGNKDQRKRQGNKTSSEKYGFPARKWKVEDEA